MTSRAVVVGRGRAGASFSAALRDLGWEVEQLAGRSEVIDGAGADLVLLCVPDAAVAPVATRVVAPEAVVAHVAGSLGLDVLGDHPRVASLHPLTSLPDPAIGARRLRDGATFAVAGDPLGRDGALALGGRPIEVADEHRAAYHAAAAIASNHLVALLDQVERTAESAGLTLDDYLPLIRQTLDNVAAVGPLAALTGPAARGDRATLDRHRAVLDPADLPAYDALAERCAALGARR